MSCLKKIKELIADNKLDIKKKFGQNFLIDQNIIDKIIDLAQINADTCVIEIGPGLGSLTEGLVKKAKKVVAYEIDDELIPILSANLREYNNFWVENKDILKINIDNEINKYFFGEKNIIVVGNLPYYITTPIVMKFLEETSRINKYVFMMQLEASERFIPRINKKGNDPLLITIDYKCDASILLKVPNTVFIPRPNVQSAVILLNTKERDKYPIDEASFYQLIKVSFTQRRKSLVNNLIEGYSFSREKAEHILDEGMFPLNIRAENLSVDDFIELSNILCKEIK